MKRTQFIYWLQGYFELANPRTIDEKGVELIKKHLALVFIHDIDPEEGDQDTQDVLNEIHDGNKKPTDNPGNQKNPFHKRPPGARC